MNAKRKTALLHSELRFIFLFFDFNNIYFLYITCYTMILVKNICFLIVVLFVWFVCLSDLSESRSREVYPKQHYLIKSVSDLRQVGGFLRVLRFPPPIKLTATMICLFVWFVCLSDLSVCLIMLASACFAFGVHYYFDSLTVLIYNMHIVLFKCNKADLLFLYTDSSSKSVCTIYSIRKPFITDWWLLCTLK
jgi:hypothetical protein